MSSCILLLLWKDYTPIQVPPMIRALVLDEHMIYLGSGFVTSMNMQIPKHVKEGGLKKKWEFTFGEGKLYGEEEGRYSCY